MGIYGGYCASGISTPLRASAPVMLSGTSSSEVYEQAVPMTLPGTEGYSWYTVSNITTVTSGIAFAAPLFVGWQEKDLSLFPPAYATALANQLKLTFSATPSPGMSSNLPQETKPAQSSGLGTGAKAGIGVGAVLGVVLVVGTAVLCLYLRRRKRRHPVGVHGNDLPEMISAKRGGTNETQSQH